MRASVFPASILRAALLLLAGMCAALALGCARRAAEPTTLVWVAGRTAPQFGPDAAPDPTRWALERLLTFGLVEEDSSGAIVPAAAERIEVSPDSLTVTFHLKPALAFTDGTACTSEDFRAALVGGLGRTDHATRAWALDAVRGVDRVRAGRPVTQLGIETPDAHMLALRLTRPDPLLLRKLALPGVSSAWRPRAGATWSTARGLGPYRVASGDPDRRLQLVRTPDRPNQAHASSAPDTVVVRFVNGAGRARALLRAGAADLMWPVPPNLLVETLPPGYRTTIREAHPARTLMLIMRADLPPTSKVATRHALTHSLNRGELVRALGVRGADFVEWFSGAGRFAFPALDIEEVQRRLDQGKLGRSFHVVMTYDQDGPAAEIARLMQGQWARLSIYVELKALKGEALVRETLSGLSHIALVAPQDLLDDPASRLAPLVMPLRGPAIGSFRTGWRTREFDAWIAPKRPAPPFPAALVQSRLLEERVALPLAGLPWVWVERTEGGPVGYHPHFGPDCAKSPAVSTVVAAEHSKR